MSLECSSSGDASDVERIVGTLDDADCRAIVSVLEEPKLVPEIAEEVDLPLSTTYRKLDRLTESGLVTETVGIREGRHHKSRYVADFDRVTIGLDDDRELRVDVDRSRNGSVGIWTNATQEF